jgi:hypothetical protein
MAGIREYGNGPGGFCRAMAISWPAEELLGY